MLKLAAAQLRTTIPTQEDLKKLDRHPLYIILDNVLDTYNVGSVFRLADAVGASKVYLCGATETPPNTRIKKASINTTEWVAWEYKEKTMDALVELREKIPGIQIVAVELDDRSVPYDQIDYHFPVALIVGHETEGVSEEVLASCDYIAQIPMWGVNISLNVMVSLAIVAYEVMKHLPEKNFYPSR